MVYVVVDKGHFWLETSPVKKKKKGGTLIFTSVVICIFIIVFHSRYSKVHHLISAHTKLHLKWVMGLCMSLLMKANRISLAVCNSYEFSRIRLHGVVLIQTPLRPSVHHMTVLHSIPLLILRKAKGWKKNSTFFHVQMK